MKRKKKVCQARGCGKKFVPYHPFKQDFCSHACRQRAYYDQFVVENGVCPVTYRKRNRMVKRRRKGVKV